MPKSDNGYPIPSEIAPSGVKSFCVPVPDNLGHRAAFFGAISSLAKWYNWQTTGDDTGKQLADVWLSVFNSITDCEIGEPSLVEFKIEDCHMFWRENPADLWIDLGNVCGADGTDGDDCTDCDTVTQILGGGYKTISDASVLPYDPLNPDSFDRYCFAAHALAVEYADATEDFMEIIRLGIQMGAPVIQWAASILVGWVPWLSNISEETLELATELLLATYTFALSQVGDIDALAKVSNEIFCALRLSYPNFDNMFDYIDFPETMPLPDILPVIGGAVLGNITNWDDMIEFAIDTWVTGEEWGWLVLAVARLNQLAATLPLVGTAVTDQIRTPNKLSIVVPEMMSRSAYFDSRDCADYDCPDETWCYEWDLTQVQSDWVPRLYEIGSNQPLSEFESGVGFKSVVVSDPTTPNKKLRFCQIRLDFPQLSTITTIEYTCSVTYAGGDLNALYRIPTPLDPNTSNFTLIAGFNNQTGILGFSGTVGLGGILIAILNGSCTGVGCTVGGSAIITNVKVSGVGVSPFDEQYECQ